jgi:hypothetical protein
MLSQVDSDQEFIRSIVARLDCYELDPPPLELLQRRNEKANAH